MAEGLRIDTRDLFKTKNPKYFFREETLDPRQEALDFFKSLNREEIIKNLNNISSQAVSNPSQFISRQELVEASQLDKVAKLVFSGFIEQFDGSDLNFTVGKYGGETQVTLIGNDYDGHITYVFNHTRPGNVSIKVGTGLDPESDPDTQTTIKLFDGRENMPFSHSILVENSGRFSRSLSTYNEKTEVICVESEKERQMYSPVES